MQQINDFISYFKNMNQEKITDIAIAVGIVIIFWIVSSLFSYLVIRIFKFKEKNKKTIKENAFYKPLKKLFVFVGIYVALVILKLPSDIMNIWNKIFRIIIILFVAKGLIDVVDPKSNFAKKIIKKDDNENKTVVNFISKILKCVIYALAGFTIIYEFGYDISGLVAGLGIGGALVALAAQDFVKGLISGISILTDKPFLVGDWICVGSNEGTVVDISFRSTKIKTADNTIITIPNATLTSSPVTNWSKMSQRRYSTNIKLPLETNADVIETIIKKIKFVLKTNKKIVPDSIEVHFNTISQEGNNIIIYLYTTVTEYNKFLAFKQEVNCQILKVLESENIKLSYPSQNIYIVDSNENKQ